MPGSEVTVRLLNYTKNGRPFWNMFTLAPVRDDEGKVRFFAGVQVDVTVYDDDGMERTVASFDKSEAAEREQKEYSKIAASNIATAMSHDAADKLPWEGLLGNLNGPKPHRMGECEKGVESVDRRCKLGGTRSIDNNKTNHIGHF